MTRAAAGAAIEGDAHIVGLIVHARPERLATLRRAVAAIDGADVHAADPVGKLVVTLEADDDATLFAQLQRIDRGVGVLGTRLVYHHRESREALQEIIDP